MPPFAAYVRWQPPMVRVLQACIPLAVGSVYFFGWRTLLLLAVVNAVAFVSEYLFTRRWKEPVTSAVFVTGTLFTFSLPPTIPVWMAVVGIIFAVVFGKMVFGGFGRNVFNPALTGRAFLYISFGLHMTAMWSEPVGGTMGGFGAWASDAITSATPGMRLKEGVVFDLLPLFLGTASGTIGGSSALLALLGGVYLLWTKTANYRIVVSCFAGYLVPQALLWLAGVPSAGDPVHAVLAGSFVVGAFFYATDPVSASQTKPGQWLYGAFIGLMSCLISVYSVWPAGTMFAILLANMFAPITDHVIRQRQARGAGVAKAAAARPA